MSKEFSNVYNPKTPFNDNLAHFLRMSKEMVESYFAANGPLARVESLPNWLERGEDGSYELVRVDDNGGVENHYGFFITIKQKPVVKYEAGKSKAVATWNYTINVPSTEDKFSYQIYSDDALKYVFAAPGGMIASIPPRMRQMQQQLPTMRIKNLDGGFALMPYVNLAFFMWLEEDEAEPKATAAWLAENMEGWSV